MFRSEAHKEFTRRVSKIELSASNAKHMMESFHIRLTHVLKECVKHR